MTNPPTDERREAFEKWATEEHGAWLDKDSHGRYTIPAEQSMWLGYQAALSHQGEAEGWRPIETAPEGVPCIVGWIDEGDECVEFDTMEEGVWQMHYGGWEHFISVAPPGGRGPSERAPYTHWMPLPPVPTSNLTALISKAEKAP